MGKAPKHADQSRLRNSVGPSPGARGDPWMPRATVRRVEHAAHEPKLTSAREGLYKERTMVPRDQGWFRIDTIVMYFFPGSGLSLIFGQQS